MVKQGYSSLDEFRGKALPHITTTEALAKEPRKIAEVNSALCNECGVCVTSCFYDALTVNGGLTIDAEKCDGCGLCVIVCPSQGMRMVEV